MDKRTFMKELEQSLSVLQKEELRDILDEYEQHIDMKVKSGLSEEEAIADFGDLSALYAEILEAYHVRADYAAGHGMADKEEDRKTGSARSARSPGKAWKNMWKTMSGAACGLGDALVRFLILCKEQVKRPFLWLADSLRGRRRAAAALAGGGVFLCRRFALWSVRLVWNACWLLFSLCCGGLGLFCLFGLGLFTVLLVQGYPLAGVTVGCLGLNLCLFSAAGLGMTFLRRKRGAGNREKDSGRDVDKENEIVPEAGGKTYA